MLNTSVFNMEYNTESGSTLGAYRYAYKYQTRVGVSRMTSALAYFSAALIYRSERV